MAWGVREKAAECAAGGAHLSAESRLMITYFKNTVGRGCVLSMPQAIWDAGPNFDGEPLAGLSSSDLVEVPLDPDTEPDYSWQQVFFEVVDAKLESNHLLRIGHMRRTRHLSTFRCSRLLRGSMD